MPRQVDEVAQVVGVAGEQVPLRDRARGGAAVGAGTPCLGEVADLGQAACPAPIGTAPARHIFMPL